MPRSLCTSPGCMRAAAYRSKCKIHSAQRSKARRIPNEDRRAMARFRRSTAPADRVCCYCGVFGDRVRWTVEHLIARINGGTSHESNLRFACAPCNYSRQDKQHGA